MHQLFLPQPYVSRQLHTIYVSFHDPTYTPEYRQTPQLCTVSNNNSPSNSATDTFTVPFDCVSLCVRDVRCTHFTHIASNNGGARQQKTGISSANGAGCTFKKTAFNNILLYRHNILEIQILTTKHTTNVRGIFFYCSFVEICPSVQAYVRRNWLLPYWNRAAKSL